MGWSLGFDSNWNREIGYGVFATCDHPECNEKIDRGLSFVCGSDPYGGEYGCGLYFCSEHLYYKTFNERNIQVCPRCYDNKEPYEAAEALKRVLKKHNETNKHNNKANN